MPKTHKDFPDRIMFNCATELRQILVAFAYLRGAGGMYSSVARDLMNEAIRNKVDAMDARQKSDYLQILENVKIQDAMRAENKKAPQ